MRSVYVFREIVSGPRRDPTAPGAAVGLGCYARRLSVWAVLAALALCPPAAGAQDSESDSVWQRFSFDAFGTLGLVYSTDDQADFVWNPSRPDGPGHSETVSPDVDSLVGAQVTFRVTPKLTAVVQAVAEQTADDDYEPHLEWANLRYDFTPDFNVRVGRLVLPGFLVSEYRKVSYATPWIRPPVEVYGLIPVTAVDGAQATYRRHVGDWTSTLAVNFGRAESDIPGDGGTAVADDALNVSALFEHGSFTGRLAVARGKLDIDAFDPLFDAFRIFGPEGEAIANRFGVDEARFDFAAVSAQYDPGRWFVISELGWNDSDSVLGEVLAGYVTGGYRRGSVTSYTTYSRSEVLSDTSHPGLSLAGLPPPLVPVAAGLNAGLNGILQGAPSQQNLSIGGRWDFRAGMALKLQVDFIDRLENFPGTFANPQPGFEPGGSAQVVSLATVFVF